MLKYITVRISIDALRCDVYFPYCLAQENNRNHIIDVFFVLLLSNFCQGFKREGGRGNVRFSTWNNHNNNNTLFLSRRALWACTGRTSIMRKKKNVLTRHKTHVIQSIVFFFRSRLKRNYYMYYYYFSGLVYCAANYTCAFQLQLFDRISLLFDRLAVKFFCFVFTFLFIIPVEKNNESTFYYYY